jgi:hypothetical protein
MIKVWFSRFRFWLGALIMPECKNFIDSHQEFIRYQDEIRPGFSERKLWEEMAELRDELAVSLESGTMSDNLVNELGDFLFCFLGREELAKELSERLEYDRERAEKRLARFLEEGA